jgi:L-2-hydroxyglutarate oxidase
VVATEPSELENLNRIHAIGLENGLSGIERVDGNQIREIEPFVEAIDGLWVPYTGIIDYRRATEVMLEVAKGTSPTSKVYFDAKVTAIEANESGTSVLATSRGSFRASRVIFCAGLEADRLAKKSGVKIPERVVGFRGDYYELTEQAKHKVRNLIYPVPNPDFPFLGVHFTRMTDGAVECGPNAVFSFKREGYNKTDFNWKDTLDALTYKGTWSLFLNHAKFGINEYRRAFSKRRFLETLQRMIPSLTLSDIEEGRSGVRALLLAENGDTRDDFRIVSNERYIHVLNAPSPAATASLAIGEQIAQEAAQKWAF